MVYPGFSVAAKEIPSISLMYLTRAKRHCTQNNYEVKLREWNPTSWTRWAPTSDMNLCDGVTLSGRTDIQGINVNNKAKSKLNRAGFYSDTLVPFLISGSDALQRNHVLGRRLVFHGPTVSLSLPLLSLCTPLLSLSPSQYLCLSLPKSVLLQRTLFFNPI